jgi:hypothetical protein
MEVEAWLVLFILTLFRDGLDQRERCLRTSRLWQPSLFLRSPTSSGSLVDRLADTLLSGLEKTKRGKRIKQWMSKNKNLHSSDEEIAFMRMKVMSESEGLTRFLDYQRSRWRVARATVFNLAIGGVAGGLYVAVRMDQPWAWALAPPAVALLLLPPSRPDHEVRTRVHHGVRERDRVAARLAQVDLFSASDVHAAGPKPRGSPVSGRPCCAVRLPGKELKTSRIGHRGRPLQEGRR